MKPRDFYQSNLKWDLGDAPFVLGIQIHQIALEASLDYHKIAILKGYLRDLTCKIVNQETPLTKGDMFSLNQCPTYDFETKEMQKILDASTMGSLMQA